MPPDFVRPLPRLALLCGLAAARPTASHAQAAPEPLPHRQDATASFGLPFKLVVGLIVLQQLTLNGQRGDFLLDTGNTVALLVERIAFASQLRAYVGGHLLGVVGYGLLRDYKVVIDYPHRRVSFYSLHAGAPTARPFGRRDSLAFALMRGLPIATGYLGKVPVPLLLDTGAAANQLDAALCQALAPSVRPVLRGTERNTGADGHHQLTRRGTLPRLLLGSTTWNNLPIQVVPLAQPAGRALAYRDLLGYPLLSQDKLISFYYGRQQFYSLTPLSPANTAPMPTHRITSSQPR